MPAQVVKPSRSAITLPLGGGVDDSVDPRLLSGPLVASAENVLLTKTGAYRKRRGMESIATADLPTSETGLNSVHDLNGVPVLYGRDGVWTRDETGDAWIQLRGGAPPVSYTRRGGVHSYASILNYDAATNGTVLVEVWTTYDQLNLQTYYRVRDLATDAIIVPPTYLGADYEKIQIVWTGAYMHLLWNEADNLFRRRYTIATDTWGAETALAITVAAWDVCASSFGGTPYWAWCATATGGSEVGIFTRNEDGTSADDVLGTDDPFGDVVRIYAEDDDIVVAGAIKTADTETYLNLARVKLAAIDNITLVVEREDAMAVTVAQSPADGSGNPQVAIQAGADWANVVCGLTSAGNVFAAITGAEVADFAGTAGDAIETSETCWNTFDFDDLTDVGDVFRTCNTVLTHRCIRPTDHNVWFGVETRKSIRSPRQWEDTNRFQRTTPGAEYPAGYLIELDETTESIDDKGAETGTVQGYPIVVCRWNHDTSKNFVDAFDGYSPHPMSLGGSEYAFPSLFATAERLVDKTIWMERHRGGGDTHIEGVYETVRGGALGVVDVLPAPARSLPVEGGILINQGSYLLSVDGVSAVENNLFSVAPEILISGTDATDTPKVRLYVIVTAKDSSGVVHRSAPSNIYLTGQGSERFYLQLPDLTLRRPNWGDKYYVQVFTSPRYDGALADLDDIPDQPYALIEEAPLIKDTASGQFYFDCTFLQDVIDGDFSRLVAESGLLGAPRPYTDGDVLPAVAPPPFLDIAAGADRLYGINGELRNEIWIGKLPEAGVAAEWNEALAVRANPAEKFTACAFLDEKHIFFSEDRIYFVPQAGLDNRGVGSSPLPEAIPSDTGCVEARSLAVVPQGLMFRGRRGYYLLDRALGVNYIGGPIEEKLSGREYGLSPLTIVAAVVVAEDHEVRICTEEGYVFIYHYLKGTWSTREGAYTHACTVDGTFHACSMPAGGWAATRDMGYDSIVWTDVNAGPADEDIFNLPVVETGWIKLNSLEGYMKLWRVLLLGETRLNEGAAYEIAGRIKISLSYDYDDRVIDEFYWPSESTTGTFSRITQYDKSSDGGALVESDTEIGYTPVEDRTLVSIGFVPDNNLTSNDTNYAVVQLVSGSTVLSEIDTRTLVGGGTGDWTSAVNVVMPIDVEDVPADVPLRLVITKEGSGVTVPAGTLTVTFEHLPRLRLRCAPSVKRCEALKIRVEELQAYQGAGMELAEVDNGPGHIWSGITLELDVIPGRNRKHDTSLQR